LHVGKMILLTIGTHVIKCAVFSVFCAVFSVFCAVFCRILCSVLCCIVPYSPVF
jgi:hypothetical protein